MIKWLRCFIFGHDFKIISQTHRFILHMGQTIGSETYFLKKCQRCKKMNEDKFNAYYEPINLKEMGED